MKRLAVLSSSLFAVAACAPQPGYQPVAAAPPPAPASAPAMAANAPGLGPSKNMGLNYDGRMLVLLSSITAPGTRGLQEARNRA
jgi:hypothetical protein